MAPYGSWVREPLGEAVDAFAKTIPEEQRSRIQRRNRWKMLMMVCLDPELRKDFLSILSTSQINSLRLLLLWKSKIFHGPGSSKLKREASLKAGGADYEAAREDVVISNTKHRGGLNAPNDDDSLDDLDDSDDESHNTDDSDTDPENAYDGIFEYLHYGETNRHALTYQDNNLTALQDMRQQAANSLFYRRLLTSYMISCNITEFRHEQVGQKYVDLEQAIQAEAGVGNLGSTIESCVWLDGKARKGLPWYLWDVEQRRTVETNDMAQWPQYIVVSHTWGRWKLPGPGADMRPQVPWLVPENSKFPVRQLPDWLQILSNQLSARYVWFDLVCIPQDRSERAQIEIARQAAIFDGAAVAAVWLNDTESWKMILNSVRWMLLSSLRKSSTLPEYTNGDLDRVDPLIDEQLQKLTSDLDSVDIPDFWNHSQGEAEPDELTHLVSSSWFSSLWTLQEVFLRPDMILMNRDWDVLTIDGQLPVPLDALISLTRVFVREKGLPPSVRWLVELLMQSNMIAYQDQHPVSILNIGCARHCKDSRSEAIMSVLGSTDWHQEALAAKRKKGEILSYNEHSLVLGRYAYDFLEEVRRKFGFAFFSSEYATNNDFVDARDQRTPMGTILPFSRLKEWALIDTKMLSEARIFVTQSPHPSLETWKLLPDGSVKIVEAGIIYATHAKNGNESGGVKSAESYQKLPPEEDLNDPADLDVLFVGPEVGGPIDLCEFNTSLKSWMDTACIDTPKYAVHLSSGRVLQGFVLKEIPIQTDTSATVLAKIADFTVKDVTKHGPISIPPTSAVNWIVY